MIRVIEETDNAIYAINPITGRLYLLDKTTDEHNVGLITFIGPGGVECAKLAKDTALYYSIIKAAIRFNNQPVDTDFTLVCIKCGASVDCTKTGNKALFEGCIKCRRKPRTV